MYEHSCMYIYHNNHCAWWEFCIVSSDIIYPLSYNYKFSQPVFTHKFRITNITMSTKTWLNESILKQLTSLFTDTNVNYCESTSTSFLKFDPNLCSFYFTNKQCCFLSSFAHLNCTKMLVWGTLVKNWKRSETCIMLPWYFEFEKERKKWGTHCCIVRVDYLGSALFAAQFDTCSDYVLRNLSHRCCVHWRIF